MASDFERILDLKLRREGQAQSTARVARLVLEQAARIVEERRAEARAFSAELVRRQTVLYDELQTKLCLRAEIEATREEIARMRGHEAALYEQAEAAERDRVKAADALDAARQAHIAAIRQVEKFRQLVGVESLRIAAEIQAGEDKEMEEFVRLGEPAEA